MVKVSDINNVGKQKERQSWKGGCVTAAIKDRYQTIVPVGSIIAITYQSPRENHGESQMKQKKASFAGMLDQQMQMLSVGKEENSTFQIYC